MHTPLLWEIGAEYMSVMSALSAIPVENVTVQSKSVSIFLRETEANLKMVSIYQVSISRKRTVLSQTLNTNASQMYIST